VGNYEVKQSFPRFLTGCGGKTAQEGRRVGFLEEMRREKGGFWQLTFVKGFGIPIYKCEYLTYTWKGCRSPDFKVQQRGKSFPALCLGHRWLTSGKFQVWVFANRRAL